MVVDDPLLDREGPLDHHLPVDSTRGYVPWACSTIHTHCAVLWHLACSSRHKVIIIFH